MENIHKLRSFFNFRILFTFFLLTFFLIIPLQEQTLTNARQSSSPSFLLHRENKTFQLQNPLILKNGITYAPFRELFSILGAEIGYTTKHGRLLVWAELEKDRFLLEKDTTAFYHNDMLLSLPGPPPVIEEKLYFPLRFLLGQAGYRLHLEKNEHPDNSNSPETNIYLYSCSQQTENIEAEEISSPTHFHTPAQKVPVLMYHHLVPEEECDGENGAIISVESFAKQMEYLFANGYRTITLKDLLLFVKGEKKLPPKCVVLTFDDGYASNYEYAYPLMKQYCFRAVQFPITGKVKFWVPRMTAEMMAASTDVFEFHSHSHNMHYYTNGQQALLSSSPEKVREDLLLSRKLLNCFAFSYPFGAYDEQSKEILKETGYKMAFTINPGYVYPGDDPFRLRRIGVYPGTKLDGFAWLLENYR